MGIRNSLAVARFAVASNARATLSRVGLAVLVGVAALGPLISLRNHGRWALDPDLLGTGLVFAAVFALRSGLAEQREKGLQTFLRFNLVSPVEHMAGMVLSLLATWVALCAAALLAGVVLSGGGDLGAAAWVAWMSLLVTGVLLPFVLLVESISTLRTPLFVPALAAFVGVFVLSAVIGVERAAEITGLVAERADLATSLPMAARAAVAMGVGFPLILLMTRVRQRGRPG